MNNWIDVNDRLPDDGVEVLCAITKYGKRNVDKSYTDVTVDGNGVEWRRMGYQIQYELLWRAEGKWENWKTDDYEDNCDYMFVVAWSNRLNYELEPPKPPKKVE